MRCGLSWARVALVFGGCVALCGPSIVAQDQFRPADLDALNILDIGPVDVGGCSCVENPFALPSLRIDPLRTGPATPLRPAPIPEWERSRLLAHVIALSTRVETALERARAGDANESFEIGLTIAAGIGVKPNDSDALAWYVLAAQQGHIQAPALVAYRYLRGIGVAPNPARAAAWFRFGADQGDPIAMTALGLLYASGRGVSQDYSAAVALWSAAAGRTVSDRFLADAYACGFGVQQDIRRAIDLYRHPGALTVGGRTQSARMYRHGCGVARDDAEAANLFELDAQEGYPEAQIEFSDMLLGGLGVPQHPYQAYMWASLAAARLAEGSLRDRAEKQRLAADRLLDADNRELANQMIAAMMNASRSR